MKLFIKIIIISIFTFNLSIAETTNPTKKIDEQIKQLEKKIGTSLKALSGKSLNKKDTKKFISEYVLILEDERSDGKVTYFFNDKEYIRYKNFKKISSGAWRFTKTGTLRVFNKDIKLTWKIKLGEKNNINIKPKFDPIGKLYQFDYQTKKDFLKELDDFNNKKEAEKKRLEQEKLNAQKKIDDEKKRLEQEKLNAQKKAEEEKKRLEQEKLEAQKKAEEEKKRLEQENLDAQKKADEEKKRLEQENLDAQKKADEEKAKLEEEKAKLEEEIAEQKRKLEEEIAEQKRKLEEEKAKLEEEIAEQKRQLEEEKLFYDLEPEYRKKCQKKMFNDLYEVGTPEYKQCIINKGPKKLIEEQKLKEKQNEKKTAEVEKKRLDQEKLVAQKKAEEEKKLLEQKNLVAQKKADEEKAKLEAQKKAEEEKKLLEQKKLVAQKKADEEKAKLEAQKKADEEKAKLEAQKKSEVEKAKLEKEIAEQKKKLEEEKLEAQKKSEEESKFNFPQYTSNHTEKLCKDKWTKRGVLDERMFKYCSKRASNGYREALDIYKEYENSVWIQDVVNFSLSEWTKRGITDYNMFGYEMKNHKEGYLNLEYEISQKNVTEAEVRNCSDKWYPSFNMLLYCLKK